MYKKRYFSFLFLVLSTMVLSAQERQTAEFGKPTEEELNSSYSEKFPDAAGVVLFEKGNTYFATGDKYVWMVKDVYRKIKVIDPKKNDLGTIEIPIHFSSNGRKERLNKIEAITSNGPLQQYVAKDDYHYTREPGNVIMARFAFPNVKEGSVLEYHYRISSPFFFSLNGWQFQNTIPTLYSEFISEIPSNFKYNRSLIGYEKLDINKAKLKKDCFYINKVYSVASCEISTYVMTNVPAFKEEDYMLSSANYIAAVDYELREQFSLDGSKDEFSKTWEDVEKTMKKEKNIGKQLRKNNFMGRQLLGSITSIKDPMERAKAVYIFIQDHFNWNGSKNMYNDVRVKEAFRDKKGNASEINLSLINALQSVDIDAKLMLSSTRDTKLPNTLYPILSDFNYVLASVTIADTHYLLDASNKNTPFGLLPYRCLNVQGRVMDFKKGSYWQSITPYKKNTHYVNTQLKATENGLFTGTVKEINSGYIGWQKRESLEEETIESFFNNKQKQTPQLELADYTIEDQNVLENPFKENYSTTLEADLVGSKVFLNPFFFKTYFTKNPFNFEERNYPIDFGFPLTNTYIISIDLNNLYTVEQLPTNTALKLPNKDGSVSVVYTEGGDKINIRLNLTLKKHTFPAEAYQGLKEFFSQLMTIQNQQPIVLKKK